MQSAVVQTKTTLMEALEEAEDQTVPVGVEVEVADTLVVPVVLVQIPVVVAEAPLTSEVISSTNQEQTLVMVMLLLSLLTFNKKPDFYNFFLSFDI